MLAPGYSWLTEGFDAGRSLPIAAILKSQGIDGLIAALNRKADMLTATTAKAS